MKTSESLTNIIPAIIAAKKVIKPPKKTKKGRSGNNEYLYADLEDWLVAVDGPLLDNNILLTVEPLSDGDKIGLGGRLFHASGEWIEYKQFFSDKDNHGNSPIKSTGSTLSYLFRYFVPLALGLAAEDIVDMPHGDKPPIAPPKNTKNNSSIDQYNKAMDWAEKQTEKVKTIDDLNILVKTFSKKNWPGSSKKDSKVFIEDKLMELCAVWDADLNLFIKSPF